MEDYEILAKKRYDAERENVNLKVLIEEMKKRIDELKERIEELKEAI